jgi:peptide/nickel transport system ATP-binding protein
MILKTENLAFHYGKKEVFSNVHFQIESGEIVGLTAPSGYGKTTFVRCLAGFETPTKGKIITNLQKTSGFNPIQLIFQHPERAVDPNWKLGKTLRESWEPSAELKEELGIKEEWLQRYPNELSGGEIQRFSVLRALNPQTKLLIADEITTMLDAITTAQIWHTILKQAKKNQMAILVISHETKLLNSICSRIESLDKRKYS